MSSSPLEMDVVGLKRRHLSWQKGLKTTGWSYQSPGAAEGDRMRQQTEQLAPRREAAD